MTINNPPDFTRIIDTNGVIIRPTVVSIGDNGQEVQWNITKPILHKIISIGDWDMDATGAIVVAHGIDVSIYRILDVVAWIHDDSDPNTTFNLALQSTIPTASSISGSVFDIGVTNILLTRAVGGQFDNLNFNATSFNRGFVEITYKLK